MQPFSRGPTRCCSALFAASRILRDDESDSVANMRLLDEVYLAAGLAPRQPSAQDAKLQVAKPTVQL